MKYSLRIALGLAIIGLAGQPAGATSYTNTIAQVTAYITNQMGAGNIQGLSIALVDDQTVVWAQGFGQADREAGVAADADTVYHIGSVSKAFLGTTYMQLRDQGRVDLEAPLTNYMPEFSMLPRFTNAGPVTIRSLLNHHSGIPGDFFNGMITTRLLDNYAPWLINCLQNDYPFAPVNQRAMYCNSGFMLLSDVIRRITGTNFPAATEAMIFSPLGMGASSFLPDKPAISNRLAAAYNTDGERQPAEILNAMGSGSLYSSVNDQAKYIRMILAEGQFQGQSIISSNGIDVMTTPQLTNLPLNVTDDPQGLGWDNADDYRFRYAGKMFWKDGATWYHCAFLGISRDLKLGVAVTQNTPGNQCDEIGAEALRWAILDKTGQHWPTNTFVPDPSPITNRPQAELDALAGLYVGSAGYYKIVAEPGMLTLSINAFTDTPTILSNLAPRANGWFSLTNSQSNQVAFTNLAGHDMLVLHQAQGAYEIVSPLGEHYIPELLPAAWAGRTNRVYRIVDMNPAEYFWEPGQAMPKDLRFTMKDGALMTEWMLGMFVIQPTNDNLAFQRGTHYRKGGAVQVSTTNLPRRSASAEPGGFELLQYSSYRFLDEAAIPTLPVNSITNGTIPFANGTQWYWFTGQSGLTYRARVTAPGQSYFVRITDREGIVLAAGTNGPATAIGTSNGTYAIAVSATNVFAFNASLTVCGLRPTQSDYDGDGKADPAVYLDAIAQWGIMLSGSGYAIQTIALQGSGSLECSADYDGDGKADPAVYQPEAGCLLLRFSSQAYAPLIFPMGNASCVPVVGDFDGDGKADPAVYSAATSQLAAWLSSNGYNVLSVPLGGAGWSNASEDYDGDGKTDPAAVQTQTGEWRFLFSSQGYAPVSLTTAGGAGIEPAPGDYDGDGKADPTLYQAANGIWLFAMSSQGYTPLMAGGWGGPTMIPRPGDYDNDGKTDPAVYHPGSRTFFILLSGLNYYLVSLSW